MTASTMTASELLEHAMVHTPPSQIVRPDIAEDGVPTQRWQKRHVTTKKKTTAHLYWTVALGPGAFVDAAGCIFSREDSGLTTFIIAQCWVLLLFREKLARWQRNACS